MLFDRFPYNNTHELNVDWMLYQIRKYASDIDQLTTIINGILADLNADYITKEEVEKLFESGNFTGTLNGVPVTQVLLDVALALTLSKTLIDTINHRESVGIILDGGAYTDTSYENTYNGGDYSSRNALLTYNVNCVRPDYQIGAY